MKPDVIVSYPRHLIFPLWNKYIKENRDRFAKVILVMTNMSVQADYTQYLKDFFTDYDITIVPNDPVTASDDWRNVAVNKGLRLSDAKYVLFTEQDFLPTDNHFWEMVDCDWPGNELKFIEQDHRMHPAFILINRELLNRTSRDFSAKPPHYDHFGKLQLELEEMRTSNTIIGDRYEHMNGLSQNLYLLQIGEEPNYRPEDFREYCRRCLELPDLQEDFKELFSWYLDNE